MRNVSLSMLTSYLPPRALPATPNLNSHGLSSFSSNVNNGVNTRLDRQPLKPVAVNGQLPGVLVRSEGVNRANNSNQPGVNSVQLAGKPWPENWPRPGSPALKARSSEKIYKDFFSLPSIPPKFSLPGERAFWGTVTAKPSNIPLTDYIPPGSFKKEHASLPLPNLKDNLPGGPPITYPAAVAESQRSREMADRAIAAAKLVGFKPLSTDMLHHYLHGKGAAFERMVPTGFIEAQTKMRGGAEWKNYDENLRQSAIRYALDNPTVKSFTIQGPLTAVESLGQVEKGIVDGIVGGGGDVSTSLGQFWAGGRAHYNVTKDAIGQIFLDGFTQRIGVDYYNFKEFGQSIPALPFERDERIHQGILAGMAYTNISGTNTKMASPFDVFIKEPIKQSKVIYQIPNDVR